MHPPSCIRVGETALIGYTVAYEKIPGRDPPMRRKPDMILFDYGHTLSWMYDVDYLRGTEAVMRHVKSNPRGLTAAEVSAFSEELFDLTGSLARSNAMEMHNHMFNQFLYDYLQLDIPLPPLERELLFFDAAMPDKPMPGIESVLDFLKDEGIRSGVISNIAFSGEALKTRINRLLPGNHFEFFIASSEYMFRKPHRLIFELALRKADLPAEAVWYCGDSPEYDIIGAASADIFPVWYQSPLERNYKDLDRIIPPECAYLHIRDWAELIAALRNTTEW